MVASTEVNRRETRGERVDKAAQESVKNRQLHRRKEDTGSVHLLRVRRQKQTVREKSSGVDRGY